MWLYASMVKRIFIHFGVQGLVYIRGLNARVFIIELCRLLVLFSLQFIIQDYAERIRLRILASHCKVFSRSGRSDFLRNFEESLLLKGEYI